MPKNVRTYRKLPQMIRNPIGLWIASKFGGLQLGKNTNVSDIHHLNDNAGEHTHTSPVIRTIENSGYTNPARLRAAKTKAYHATKNS